MAASRSCIVTGIRHRPTFHAPSATGIAGTGTVHPPLPCELRLASTPTVPPQFNVANQRRQLEAASGSCRLIADIHSPSRLSMWAIAMGCLRNVRRSPSGLWRAKKRRAPGVPENLNTERYQAKSGSMPGPIRGSDRAKKRLVLS